jgi:hypothetical protein
MMREDLGPKGLAVPLDFSRQHAPVIKRRNQSNLDGFRVFVCTLPTPPSLGKRQVFAVHSTYERLLGNSFEYMPHIDVQPRFNLVSPKHPWREPREQRPVGHHELVIERERRVGNAIPVGLFGVCSEIALRLDVPERHQSLDLLAQRRAHGQSSHDRIAS